jgi:hypothetical protein
MTNKYIYVRQVSQTTGTAGAPEIYFCPARPLRLAGIRVNRLARDDTVKDVQKTIWFIP